MKRSLVAAAAFCLPVASLSLAFASTAMAADPTVAVQAKAVPKVALCVGAGGTAGIPANPVAVKPAVIVVDCPAGAGDSPIGTPSYTYLSGMTWTKWSAKGATGSGSLNVPVSECTYTSPKDGTPDEVKTMCDTSGQVGHVTTMQTYPASVVLSRPAKLSGKQQTFTTVVVTFPNGGPNGETSHTYKPARKAT